MYLILKILCILLKFAVCEDTGLNAQLTKVWGPGLIPDKIIMSARYFFIQGVDGTNQNISNSLENDLQVVVDGTSTSNKPCRLWMNKLDRKDGSYIVRYKVYETCTYIKIDVKFKGEHVAESPYITNNLVHPDECNCPFSSIQELIDTWQCGESPTQIREQLGVFRQINWDDQRDKLIENFDKPHSISICHYVTKNNRVYRKCYGKYVGFNMFVDNILFSLSRKSVLPDLEFFVNLGDWPLASTKLPEKYPILSWCGSTDSYDIILPTYDITESTLENMGRVMLDMLSVQGNVETTWENRISKLFWRGRDSNQQRLDLIDISKKHPDLFNVSLTNFFFFRDKEHIYGPKSEHISFFKFFDYKYQLAIDGTVAAYRMPYLLGGGSLVFKQDSKYFEHFYKDLVPYEHYVPVKRDLSDLVDKINWAIENDEEAQKIAKNGQHFAASNLLPQNILCYHAHLLNEFSKLITSKVEVLDTMEEITSTRQINCDCSKAIKDEL